MWILNPSVAVEVAVVVATDAVGCVVCESRENVDDVNDVVLSPDVDESVVEIVFVESEFDEE